MIILAIFLFIGAVCGVPVNKNPRITPGLIEGDRLGVESSGDRNAVPHDSQRWVDGVVPYVIDSTLEEATKVIKKAMDHIADVTCLTFVERTDEKDYVKLFKGEGCNSAWGRTGGGEQPLSLGEGCWDVGTAVHELLHAIGLEHEHNRSDRDEFLSIIWKNVEKQWYFAFEKLKPSENRLLTPFDYDSIMLYEATAFSKKPGLITIQAKDGRYLPEYFNKKKMSAVDAEKIKLLYQCDSTE